MIYFEEVDEQKRGVFLRGVTAPKGGIRKDAAFEMGGTLRSPRTYEPGIDRPVRHVMGAAEGDWEFEGQLRDGQIDSDGGAQRIQTLIEDIRRTGRELRIVWGNEIRRGFLMDARFPIEGSADRIYKLKFEIDDVGDQRLGLDHLLSRAPIGRVDLDAISDVMFTHRTALLAIPGLSIDVASAITDLFDAATRPLTNIIGAAEDLVDSVEDARQAFRRVANALSTFLDRLEHLSGTIDSYSTAALDLEDGRAIAAWTRARVDALAAFQDAAAAAWEIGADAERRTRGSTARVYVSAELDTVEGIARREGTTPEAIWALNPDLPMAPAVGTRIKLP